ncbi:MAG: sulfotransferase, partial [Aestuariivirgaceae bacterium]
MTKLSYPPKLPDQTARPPHARLLEAENARRGGNLARAQSLCEALLAQHPTYVGALQTLGAVHQASNNSRQALSCFIQAAMLCPKDGVNLVNLAGALVRSGARQLAAQVLEQAKKLIPDDHEIYLTLAEIHREERDYPLAVECFRKALALAPSNAEAAHGLGDSYCQLGLVGEAADALKMAHGLEPRSVYVLHSLTQLPPRVCPVDLKAALAGVQRHGSQTGDEFEAVLGFAKSAVLDRCGKYEEAWKQLVLANRREKGLHAQLHGKNRAKMVSALERARRFARPAQPAVSAMDCPVSLFILGASRSGKTSLELLLGQCEGVKRGFESRFAETAAKRTSQQSALLTISNPEALPPALDGRFAEIYGEDIRDFGRHAKIVTDTYPAMISYLGRVAVTLPNCRFVFVRRDRQDLALRIFMRHFKAGNHYGYDVKTILEYIAWYDELADLWFGKFPEISLQIAYEDTVADPSAILTRVAAFCGIDPATNPLPDIGDDRGCARPYQSFMAEALA